MAIFVFVVGLLLLSQILIAFAIPARYFGFVVAGVVMLLLLGWVSAVCHPQPHFARGLPWF